MYDLCLRTRGSSSQILPMGKSLSGCPKISVTVFQKMTHQSPMQWHILIIPAPEWRQEDPEFKVIFSFSELRLIWAT